jgi:hypothetical protein
MVDRTPAVSGMGVSWAVANQRMLVVSRLVSLPIIKLMGFVGLFFISWD